jgi:phage baseplate assembly protein W
VPRRDYAHPLQIGAARQVAEAPYAAHVAQMVRQVLLTAPGERINRPTFGCGLRRLVFAPHADQLDATTNVLVRSALERWLGAHIDVRRVSVTPPEVTGDAARLEIVVEYELRETREGHTVGVLVAA